MSFLMTHVLQEKQLPKQIPIYPQAPSPPVLPRMQPLYQPTHTGLLNQYTLESFSITSQKKICLYTNCDSLLNKLNELQIRLFDKNTLICGVTEIRPKHCLIKPEENDFKILNYNLYTNIKDSQNGRGTGLFIHISLNFKESEFVFNKGHVESVWAEVKLTETEILLCAIVCKSQKEKENDILRDLFMSVSKLKNYTHLLIMGDFNYPDIDWENWSSNDITSQKFIETVQDAYLF